MVQLIQKAKFPCRPWAKHGHDTVTDVGEMCSGAQPLRLGPVNKKTAELENVRLQKIRKVMGL